jgi:charged multivesicular body protein 2A
MVMMNRQMNLPAMQRVLQNFEIESEKMDMKQEMMADVMGDIFEEDGEEEATDEIINQVLDEIGINLSSEVRFFPCISIVAHREQFCSSSLMPRLAWEAPPR